MVNLRKVVLIAQGNFDRAPACHVPECLSFESVNLIEQLLCRETGRQFRANVLRRH